MTASRCRECGHTEQTHGLRWVPEVGWHTYQAPTPQHRVRERLRQEQARQHQPSAPLFGWTPDGDATPTEIVENPRARYCDPKRKGCGSRPGDPCTRPGRGGRVPIRGYHTARTEPSTQETR